MRFLVNPLKEIQRRFKDLLDGFKEGYDSKEPEGKVYQRPDGTMYAKIGEHTYDYNIANDSWMHTHADQEKERRLKSDTRVR